LIETSSAALLNPGFVDAPLQLKSVQDAARAVGLKLDVADASTERDARMVEARAGALVVFSDPFLFSRREKDRCARCRPLATGDLQSS
jgi:hypothetical protein